MVDKRGETPWQSPQWRFADFRLDPDNACLWRGAQAIALTPKAFAVLHYLVTHADRLVTKDALLEAVWPETAVSDAVVRMAIGELRRALGDTAQAPRYIATVRGGAIALWRPSWSTPRRSRPHRLGAPCCLPMPLMAPPDAPAVTARYVAVHPRPRIVPPPGASRRPTPNAATSPCCSVTWSDSTALAGALDPEDYREVVRAYHETCAEVIARFDGYMAQYLGDGVLVYFGYPVAHEDDAQRAVRAGLGMLDALGHAQYPPGAAAGRARWRCGWGSIPAWWWWARSGRGTRHEPLALGETPNIAARLQGTGSAQHAGDQCRDLAARSAASLPVRRWARHAPEGLAQPLEVYRVLDESAARSRLEVAGTTGLTPLVGREQEVGLLLERWAQVKEGMGQVVLLSGEAGIGKSRLVQVLQEHVASEPQAWLTPCQCSPYLPAYGPVSADRAAGAGGAALRARGVPAAEAQQTGGVPGAVWPAAGRGSCPSLPRSSPCRCRPPMPP